MSHSKDRYTCFECFYRTEDPFGDRDCRLDSEFAIPYNPSDYRVIENCLACGLTVTKKSNKFYEVNRFCVYSSAGQERDEWKTPKSECLKVPLVDGEMEHCYCNTDFYDLRGNPPSKAVTCYRCSWEKSSGRSLHSSQCDIEMNFSYLKRDIVNKLEYNCEQCQLKNELVSIERGCIKEINIKDKWRKRLNSCYRTSLKRGEIIDCFCENNYCNSRADDIPDVCDQVRETDGKNTLLQTSTTSSATTIINTISSSLPGAFNNDEPKFACFQCLYASWDSNTNRGCGWGENFTIPSDSPLYVLNGCNECKLIVTWKGNIPYEIFRLCLTYNRQDPWQYEQELCTKELLYGGENEFCSSVAVKRTEKKILINCFQCLWRINMNSTLIDQRCRHGNNFSVPHIIGDSSVVSNCSACYMQTIWRGDQVYEVQRTCQGKGLVNRTWQDHQTSCSDNYLAGGKEEHCFCEEDFCNDKSNTIANICHDKSGGNHFTMEKKILLIDAGDLMKYKGYKYKQFRQ
ncbi:DgyrCDS7088 [Dimorphilus gyrociliatus]|uniref:DgyrCDS7088 n=1 Tax=Dimorphilus gyrociliatus TaxID=2664684 RepID=A0A7I8VSN6_9ANNE|nr:DgyrCDS7088 [Dimorphilus gyrociliatus]